MKQLLTLILMAMPLFLFTSCASKKEMPEARPHRATVVNDLFPVEQGMPVREVRGNQEFFFKKCEVSQQRPYFSKTEYDCTDQP